MCENKINRHVARNRAIIQQIGIKYDPKLSIPLVNQIFLMDPGIINVERMLETLVARTGNLEFVDEAGYDYSDKSELKMATVHHITGEITIGNMEGKVGALRIIIYNAKTGELAYFFVPKAKVSELCGVCYGKQRHKMRIRLCYHTKNKTYGKLEPFKLDSFAAMCRLR